MKPLAVKDMPNGTHLIKYQDNHYQAFWQSYELGVRFFFDATTPEKALEKLLAKITEVTGKDKE